MFGKQAYSLAGFTIWDIFSQLFSTILTTVRLLDGQCWDTNTDGQCWAIPHRAVLGYTTPGSAGQHQRRAVLGNINDGQCWAMYTPGSAGLCTHRAVLGLTTTGSAGLNNDGQCWAIPHRAGRRLYPPGQGGGYTHPGT